MKPVAQLVHTLSYGDAISGEVLALERVFKSQGRESLIFALNVHPFYQGRAKKLEELPADFSGELILHYSLGSPLNERYRSMQKAQRTLIYHNLTPAKWFEAINPRIVSDINSGLQELPELCKISDKLVSDSTYNAGELKALGFTSAVLPLPLDDTKWNIETNQGIAALLQGDPALHLLHVGRIAPNKCIEDIIRTFYFIHSHIEPNSKLWLVGIDIDTELYSFALKRLVHELELGDAIRFTGGLADSEVKALYQHASAYLCMSEHEGFCLPVIEAMQFGLPVFAYAGTALPETVGEGGVLFSEKRHAELAELIVENYRNPTLRQQLVTAGKKRAQVFTFESFSKNVTGLW